LKKIVVGPRVSVSSQNEKIIGARPPDPTVNKGDDLGLLKISHLY
jgi:hypothetical protein